MITAVDSSVVLDVVVDDPAFADGSEALLRRCMAEGKLISDDAKHAVLALPVPSATEYDLEIRGEWLDGSGEMFVLLRRDGHSVRFKLNAFHDQGTVQGLSIVDGKHLKEKTMKRV